MSEAPTEPVRPGCLLCLLQTSASMYQLVRGEGKEFSKLSFARGNLDRILDNLLALDSPRARGLHVGVVGYSAQPSAAPAFTSLLPGVDREPFLVPLAELAEREVPRRAKAGIHYWIDADRTEGAAHLAGPHGPAGAALAYAYHLVQTWLGRHPGAWPPIVLLCCDGEGGDRAHVLACTSLSLLSTAGGRPTVAHLAVSEHFHGLCRAKKPDEAGPRIWQALWELSSPLAAGGPDPEPYRALSINSDPWPMIEHALLAPPAALVPWPAPTAEGPPAALWQDRALCHVKKGNAESEWEDAQASDPARLVAAVSDGASEGIFAKAWSHLLARSFVSEAPDLGDTAVRSAWLEKRRADWAELINVQSLRWSQQNKVNQTGAAATLLTLQVHQGPGPWRWRSWAVGDSCLFLVRDNQLRAAFPVVASAHFAMGPPLLRTNGEASLPAPVCAEGTCRPGDLFVLATDAVAEWMLRQVEGGAALDWGGLTELDEEAWRRQIDAAREEQRIVNDDCTLLVVRVGGATGDSADRLQGR